MNSRATSRPPTSAEAPSPEEAERLASWFAALADPTRMRILYVVLDAGEVRVGDLATAIDAPESTVSHALRWLRGAGIVRPRREGKMAYYRLDDEHVRTMLELGRAHLRHRGGAR